MEGRGGTRCEEQGRGAEWMRSACDFEQSDGKGVKEKVTGLGVVVDA